MANMKPTSLSGKIIVVLMISTLSALLYREYTRLPPAQKQAAAVALSVGQPTNTKPTLSHTEYVIGPTEQYGSPAGSTEEAFAPQAF